MGSREGAAFTLPGGHTFSCAMPMQETVPATVAFAEGLAWPSPEHEIQPPLLQQAATSQLYVQAHRDAPTWHFPPGQLCPNPTVQKCWEMASAAVAKCMTWAAACFGQCAISLVPHCLHLSRSISNLLHRFYTGTRAEVSV